MKAQLQPTLKKEKCSMWLYKVFSKNLKKRKHRLSGKYEGN